MDRCVCQWHRSRSWDTMSRSSVVPGGLLHGGTRDLAVSQGPLSNLGPVKLPVKPCQNQGELGPLLPPLHCSFLNATLEKNIHGIH